MGNSQIVTAISRIWLVLVNIIFLGISLLSFIVGAAILNLSRTSTAVVTSAFLKSLDMKTGAYLLFVLGAFFLITALSGCFGGLCRLTSFLTFYIVAVVLNMLLLAGGGFYSIYNAVGKKAAWQSMTLSQWNALSDQTKDFVQQAFKCCAFETLDSAGYTGPSTNFFNSSPAPTNACPSATLPGCHPAGTNIYTYFVTIISVATCVGLVTCLVSVAAANAARRRRALVENGFLRTSKASKEHMPLL